MTRVKSKADVTQIARSVFNEQNETIMVELSGLEVGIELDAQDGDSVLTYSDMEVIHAEADQIIDTSKAKVINLVQKTNTLSMTCTLGDVVIPVVIGDGPRALCLPNIKVSEKCIIILQS